MAKIKIQGNASGTGVLTIEAPNTSTDRTITLPDVTGTLLTTGGDGSSLTGITTGKVLQVVTAQTRTISTYSAPSTGDGTEVSPLTLTMTPTTAGNKVILEWNVNGEAFWNTVYIVTRNGTRLTDTTDASNNRWAGITTQPFDNDNNSTPDNAVVKIIDNSCLSVESIYRLHVRSSAGTANTLYLNRTQGSTGATGGYETTLSTGTAMEVTA